MTQTDALQLLKQASNVFVTGQPGSGKSYLTNQYVDWLLDNGKNFAVTASTGIAALNVSGKTLHSFAGLRNDNKLTDDDVQEILGNSNTYRRYTSTDILIIDEISMVSAQLFENIDRLAKLARRSDKPFGGMKVVAVGDFYQLPPINGEYCFTSNAWKNAGFSFCNLTEQHRTNDGVFIDILTGIRKGVLTSEQREYIRARYVEDVSTLEGVIRLDTHNIKVDEINQIKLSRLTATPRTYRMTSDGQETYVESLKKNCLSPDLLILKVGARVIFTRNDIEERWVNGTQGEVIAMNEGVATVKLYSNGVEVEVEPVKWEHCNGYGKSRQILASISQLPLRLAWAITVHKSQGMTLDKAIIDVTRVFATGQAYVAISRVRSLDGVYLQGKLTAGFLKVDDQVKDFYANNL